MADVKDGGMASTRTTGVAVPTYDSMLWPTLEALKQLGGSGTNQEIVEKLSRIAGYSEEQQNVLHGSGPETEIAYRAAWARTYLKAVGALANSARGVWTFTDYGRSLKQSERPSGKLSRG